MNRLSLGTIWLLFPFLLLLVPPRGNTSTFEVEQSVENSEAFAAQKKTVEGVEKFFIEHYNDSLLGEAEYRVLLKDGTIEFNSYDLDFRFPSQRHIPRLITVEGREGPSLTDKQRKLHKQTKKIPPSYKAISRDQAVEIAKGLVQFLLGDSADIYDSIVVLEFSTDYIVKMHVPQVGDVFEGRKADVEINSATGRILSYYGDTFRSLPPDYQPQITRSQATTITKAYGMSQGFEVRIHDLFIHNGSICVNGKRPVWQALIEVGRKENGGVTWYWSPCEQCFRCAICVDAETGEVTGANLPSKLEE